MYDIVVTSGYFDPLHIGHVEYLRRAKELGRCHLVIVNNDFQAGLKKGKAFMPQYERLEIIRALKFVDGAILAYDFDGTVCQTLETVFSLAKQTGCITSKIAFCKGGDRLSGEIPEGEICSTYGVSIVDGLGEKIQSSSALTGLTAKTARQEELS